MSTYSAAVLGASGYSGGELLRYLSAHPALEVAWVTAESNAGKTVGEIFGNLPDLAGSRLEPTEADSVPDVDVAFLALPHGTAAETGRRLAARGIKVVDLSADWRLDDPDPYVPWYGYEHPHPEELSGWTYGLPEVHRSAIAATDRVANPGCYPTAALLALVPLVREGVVEGRHVIISAASGVSGAGRKVEAGYLLTELDGSYKAYGAGTHRATPEIEQELSKAAGSPLQVTFVPHLAPMSRGELVTCFVPMSGSGDDIRDVLTTAYKGETFVHVVDGQPSTKQTAGSNLALIGVGVDEHTSTAIVTCAIDNLGKGAAGQAVQNANLMLGIDETAGLQSQGVFP
jgi:N-acetyl-gamma-glutamyl-phosphate reductase